MASHSKAEVLATIRRDGVVPVFFNADIDIAREVARRLVAGGVSTIEFTNRGDGAIEVFADLVRWARHELPELVVGVGTVVDATTAAHVIDLGANFVFAPALSPEVAAVCNGRNVPYVPGCATLTEIQAAYRLGSDFVKLFPAGSIGGPAFLSAIRAPCPWVQAIPTGGVEPDAASIKAWFDAGAPAVGMGSKLLPGEMIGSRDWVGIEERIAGTVAAVAQARDRSRRMALGIKPSEECRWDAVSLGEVMLRFDPEFGRVRTTRHFKVSEGGGEYNVARALRKVFGLRTAIVTALVDSELGHLLEDLMMTGGVDLRHVQWVPHDGIGRSARLGLNFVEKGFGPRAALGVSDRANTAVSQLEPGDIDWHQIFEVEGVRWLHTGGIFAALSDTTAEVAIEAVQAAKAAGTVVSYDLNYRPSLWEPQGGQKRAIAVNRRLAEFVDVMIGNEEDFTAALGFAVPDLDHEISKVDPKAFKAMIGEVVAAFPNFQIVATTLRNARTAGFNDWGAVLFADGEFHESRMRENLEIYDRVGGGDGFASGMIWSLLDGRPPGEAVEIGAAHGALTMSTPGDTSMMSKAEVLRAVAAKGARVVR